MEPFVNTDIKYVKTSNCAYHLVHKCPMKRSMMQTGSGFVVCVISQPESLASHVTNITK
jgi:hypothetical protein